MLIDFSLDYDIPNTTEVSIEREDTESQNYLYNTMHNKIKNLTEQSKGDLDYDDVQMHTPTKNTPFNFKNLKNDE